jgi:hypothetical protein
MSMSERGKIDRIDSSNSNVKSNPPRQVAACGPKLSSILEQEVGDKVAMVVKYDHLLS